MSGKPPLIVHIIYRLDVGGLENGLVNLINRLPAERYRHAIVCLTDSSEFSRRIHRRDVAIYALHKRPGQDWRSFYTLYRLLKRLHPAVVHTRNLAALEYQVCSWLAGVPYRVHGEHGWDVFDPDGDQRKYQYLRRIMAPFVHRFIALSRHLQDYLQCRAKIPAAKISRIGNGVDTQIFYPRGGAKIKPVDCPLALDESVVIGTVGRMQGIKNQLLLVEAFILACSASPLFAERGRLFLVGDGPLRARALELLAAKGLSDKVWLPGERSDVADILRCLDIFVLPSRAEGISNTILEAMACGLPVIACRVGGNPELVEDAHTGYLVEKDDVGGLAAALQDLLLAEDKRRRFGTAARLRVEAEFSLEAMVERYRQIYDARLVGS